MNYSEKIGDSLLLPEVRKSKTIVVGKKFWEVMIQGKHLFYSQKVHEEPVYIITN